jgi:hypothetical protein
LAAPETPPIPAVVISSAVKFFLFLAGVSETFIPNVLRDSEQNAGTGGPKKKNPEPQTEGNGVGGVQVVVASVPVPAPAPAAPR